MHDVRGIYGACGQVSQMVCDLGNVRLQQTDARLQGVALWG